MLQEKKQRKNVRINQKKYFSIAEFIIFGSPASSKNSRSGHFLSPSAQKYSNIFDKQAKRIKERLLLKFPFNDRKYLWSFEIWYSDIRSDASIELIWDLMQKNEMITNDNSIRNYLVLSEDIDREVPRTIITIYKEK